MRRLIEIYSQTVPLQRLLDWLEEAIPVFVWKYMIDPKVVKVCGVMSHAVASAAVQAGIPMKVASLPRHFIAVCETDSGAVEIDMTHIQFETARMAGDIADQEWSPGDPHGDRRATRRAVERITRNPYDAVSVKRMRDTSGIPLSDPDPTPMDYRAALRDATEFFGVLPSGKVTVK